MSGWGSCMFVSNYSLSRAIYGRIMCHGIISSFQSAATYDIVKCYWSQSVLGKILFTCIFDTDTDTWSQMYLIYRYKILHLKCIKDTDTTKKYLDTRYIEDGYSLIDMIKCYLFNKMLPSSSH